MQLEEKTSKLALEDQMVDQEEGNSSGITAASSSPPLDATSSTTSTTATPGAASGAAAPAPATTTTSSAAPAASKPKRVRTGCLTCRERHLKCDEGLPSCLNCRKSSRTCKRGVRLNFIDTQVKDPQIIPPSADWSVGFQDESREIASEYKGGAGRYAVVQQDDMDISRDDQVDQSHHDHLPPPHHHQQHQIQHQPSMQSQSPSQLEQQQHQQHQHQHQHQQQHQQQQDHHIDHSGVGLPPPNMAPMIPHQPLPPIQVPPQQSNNMYDSQTQMIDTNSQDTQQHHHHHQHHSSNAGSHHSNQNIYPSPNTSYSESIDPSLAPPGELKDCLNSAEETLFMQVFVEEVGLWMDSLDPHKHFSRILPFYALGEPMLLNAFLACGARHLTLVNPAFQEDKALHYYDTATRGLLKSLQNPNRDTIICATAAVILNVYEIMSERALQRMNHIAGARALIKECGWSARSVGIGAACFWLNVGMELLSCLHFNWQVAWNPDDWGVDMDMVRDNRAGQEENWTYKIVYIAAKVANFRASIPRFTDGNPTAQAMRLQGRLNEWNRLKDLCDTWNSSIPRTMHPAAVLHPSQTASKSAFPEVWLIKRTSIAARLFFHTCMCLMPQMHPTIPPDTPEMFQLKMYHARQICGIVAHVKDRGVASMAIRCIALAAECLTDYKEQEEVLATLEKIKKETGWRIDFLMPELKKKWGWDDEFMRQRQHQQQMQAALLRTPPLDYNYQSNNNTSTSLPAAPPIPAPVAAPPSSNGTSGTGGGVPLPQIPRGIVNPLMRTADFSAPTHPYQNYYVAPNQHHNEAHYFYRLIDGNYH